MKKKIFKKNQIVITALAILIAVAGYINYADSTLKKDGKTESTAVEGEAWLLRIIFWRISKAWIRISRTRRRPPGRMETPEMK